MARVGWMQDSHVRPTSDVNASGADGAITTDLRTLFETKNVSETFFTGDLVHPTDKSGVPHVGPDAYNRFWGFVDDSGHGDKVTAIPGNHEIPVQTFLATDDRSVLRKEVVYPGVRFYLINTAATGFVTGSPGEGTSGGTGPNAAYVPYRDYKWLDERLSAAGSDAKVILSHHALYFTNNSGMRAYSPDGNLRADELYDICTNYNQLHSMLSTHSKVVSLCSHLYQFSYEGSYTKDGVVYGWKKHYYQEPDGLHTFAYIDADASGVTVTTVDHGTGTENTIVNTTY